MSRRFTRSQKLAAAVAQGVDIQGLEADHVKPFSKGGETSVDNCQMISPEANRAKGSNYMELRQWQADFIDRWDNRESGRPFLLVAIPGGGKTFAALMVVKSWLAAGNDRAVLIVVPTQNLQEQWMRAASKEGIEIQTDEFGTRFKHGYRGGCATYASIGRQSLSYRAICNSRPTMVVCDELHHCSTEASWGDALLEACTPAKEMLLLSGTPWKTDGRPIPFVRYDGDGFCVADMRYDYPQALLDEVVRWMVFKHTGGTIRFDVSGEEAHVNKDIADDEASRLLWKLLSPTGDYVREQVRDAHQRLLEIRRTIPDAGAMAACIDTRHAVAVAEVIKRETGCTASIIVSDSECSTDTVERFAESNKEWVVAVKQVSEGTDIPRLQVLCYLTNTVTELFFRQLIGRVSRVRGLDDQEAHVYLPADPRLVRFVQNIENAQVLATKELRDSAKRHADRQEPTGNFETYSTSRSGLDVVMIGNREYSLDEAHVIETAAAAAGISLEKAAKVIDAAGGAVNLSRKHRERKPQTLRDLEKELRAKCSAKAYHVSRVLDIPVKDVHREFKPQSTMTVDELRAKLRTLHEKLGGESK